MIFSNQHHCEPASPMTTYAASVSAAVGHHHDANLRHRRAMEDEMSVHECDNFPGLFVGVYDGHGGNTASKYLRHLFHRLFLDELLNEELAIAPQPKKAMPVPPTSPSNTTTKRANEHSMDDNDNDNDGDDDDDMHSTCSTPPYDEDEDDEHEDGDADGNKESLTTTSTASNHSSLISNTTTGTPVNCQRRPQSTMTSGGSIQSPADTPVTNASPHTSDDMMSTSPSPSHSTSTSMTLPLPSPASSSLHLLISPHPQSSPHRRRRRRTSPTIVVPHPLNTAALDVERAFRVAYPKMDTVLRLRNCARLGATAVTAFLRRVPTCDNKWYRTLTIANCGDSRAVLCRNGSAVELTKSHRPSDPGERARIEQKGGFVTCGRINGLLNVSRAFGNHWMKSIVECTPHVCTVEIEEGGSDEFVVFACDGLWDFVEDQRVCDLVRRCLCEGMAPHAVAQRVVEQALAAGSTDNISVLVVQFNVDDDED